MALLVNTETMFGTTQQLYVRLNCFEQLANHGVPAIALFRGFASQEAFESGKHYMQEWTVEFPADAPEDPWALAYTELRKLPGFENAVEV